jgi:hypothetical protein
MTMKEERFKMEPTFLIWKLGAVLLSTSTAVQYFAKFAEQDHNH